MKSLLQSKIFLFTFLTSSLALNYDAIVETKYGKVGGESLQTPKNKTFYAFKGIPYAKPPIGDLRYKPPQLPDPWEGVYDDRGAYRQCIQIWDADFPNEDEDCLYLHVYTPQIPTAEKNISLPVLFMIHGGAFIEGSSDIYSLGPHNIIDYDIVVVSIAYRLGLFGFLSTGDLNCPGNNGLKDQQLGLRWVQENIHNFGGDPDKVTLFGQSAGGASVSYHKLGSNAAGLFRGGIQDSGTALATWAVQKNPRSIAYMFANYVDPTINETNTSVEELMEFYRNIEVPVARKATIELFGGGLISQHYKIMFSSVFVPTVEPDHKGAFISRGAYEKLSSGDYYAVPTLMGINSEESLFLSEDEDLIARMKYYDENLEWLLPPSMNISDKTVMKTVGQDIRKLYVGDSFMYQNEGPSIKFDSDTTLGRPTIKEAKLESLKSDIFYYEFAYNSPTGHHYDNIPGAEKVPHGQELRYLLYRATHGHSAKGDDLMQERMLTMWTNFVKYLNPTPEPVEVLQNITWPKIDSIDNMPYMLINETLAVRYNLKKEMTDVYDRLFDLYAVPPLNTY